MCSAKACSMPGLVGEPNGAYYSLRKIVTADFASDEGSIDFMYGSIGPNLAGLGFC